MKPTDRAVVGIQNDPTIVVPVRYNIGRVCMSLLLPLEEDIWSMVSVFHIPGLLSGEIRRNVIRG